MRYGPIPRFLVAVAILVAGGIGSSGAHAQGVPTFSKVFSPDTVGPGSTSRLTFTITNGNSTPVTDLAFVDTLPAGMELVAAPNAISSCADTTLSATGGTGTITLTSARLGGSSSCTIAVNVTTTGGAGSYDNTSGDLTSSAGNSGTATDTLNVTASRPNFTKSFAPSSISIGAISTLTFTIDNTANASPVPNLDFTDNLPSGVEVASPSNASTTCGTGVIPATLTATNGSSAIVLDSDGTFGFPAIAAGASCTVTVKVKGASAGTHVNTVELLAEFASAGFASAALTVTGAPGAIQIVKEFTDDPVAANGTVTLDFTLSNTSRDHAASGIAFTDDLTATLTGLTGTVTSNTCGGTASGGSLISLSGGTLPAQGNCVISTSLSVPPGAAGGSYPNSTSTVTATINGAPTAGNQASDTLFVTTLSPPVLSKSFSPASVIPGDTVSMEFTITNPNSGDPLTDIQFTDDMTAFMPGVGSSYTLPANGYCGAGSTASVFSPFGGEFSLAISGANLAASGSCTFSVGFDVPGGASANTYTNTTSTITATGGGVTLTGSAASAGLTVGGTGTVSFSKAFAKDNVQPNETVNLTFEITSSADSTAVTGIGFTDNLDADFIAGATVQSIGGNTCGGTASGTGTGTFTLSGGGLAGAGDACTITIVVQIPGMPGAGTKTNTTSVLSYTAGTASTAPAATDTIDVTAFAPLVFSKEFVNDPALPGETITLRFTIQNTNAAGGGGDATITFFTDTLSAALAGLAATGVPTVDTCGGTLGGTTTLIYVGGAVAAGATCTIDVPVLVPLGAADGTYGNTTSQLIADVGGAANNSAPAVDNFTVDSSSVLWSKSFTDDPVAVGGIVTLEFTLENTNASYTAQSISFTDDLNAALGGLSATALPPAGFCGAGSTMSGTTNLAAVGLELAPAASCTFSVNVTVPGGAAPGSYVNTTSALSYAYAPNGAGGTIPYSNAAASDTLVVTDPSAPVLTKTFLSATGAGQLATLRFSITKAGATGATNLGFTDDLNAMLAGAVATGLPASACGGTISGTSFLNFIDGSVAGGTTCSFDVTVQIPTGASAGTYANTTSALSSGGIIVGSAASANLEVEPPPTLTKSFTPSTAEVAQPTTMEIQIDNTASVIPATSLNLTDNFPGGLVIAPSPNSSTTCSGGTLTATAGASSVSFTGGAIAAASTCSVFVDVTATSTGNKTNTADMTSTLGTSPQASALLSVVATQPLTLAKSFSAPNAEQGQSLTMTLEIANPNGFLEATSVALFDTFPSGLIVSGTTTGSADCNLGTVSSSIDRVGFTGSLAATGTCTITVPVTVTGAGPSISNTATLDSAINPTTATASAGLTVGPAAGPVITKAFSTAAVAQSEALSMTITLRNPNTFLDITDVDMTDTFPAGLQISTAATSDGGCLGGTLGGGVGATTLTYTDGRLAVGQTCTITLGVTPTAPGSLTNTAGVTSVFNATAATATDFLSVSPAGAPLMAKTFSANTGVKGESLTMSLVIENQNAFQAVTDISLNDPFPTGLEISGAASMDAGCAAGTLTGNVGDTNVSFSNGRVEPAATCTIIVGVTITEAVDILNIATMTSSLNTTAIESRDGITVAPVSAPTLEKSFSASAVVQGETLSMTLAITNSNSFVGFTNVALTDTFPAGLVVSTAASKDASCNGGTLVGAVGATEVTYSGGQVDAGSVCTVTVGLTVPGNTDLTNTASVVSDQNTTPVQANANLDVTPAPPPGFSKAFDPSTIFQYESTRVRFRIDNSAALVEASALTFAETFTGAIQVAASPNVVNTCPGGTLTANPGDTGISFAGATLPAGASCELALSVTGNAVGVFPNTSGALTSSLGASGTASATLTVKQIVTGELTIVQEADPDGTFAFSSSEAALNFQIQTVNGTGKFGPIKLLAGNYEISQALPQGFGNLSVSCSDDNSVGDAAGRKLKISLQAQESLTCTFKSLKTDQRTIDVINKFLFRRADLILSSAPDMGRRIDRLNRGFGNSSPVSFSNGDIVSMLPFRFDPLSISAKNVEVTGSFARFRETAAKVALAHGAPEKVQYVENYRWDAWFEASYKQFDDSDGNGDFVIAYFGADYLLTKDLLVGAMLQIDRLEDNGTNPISHVEGTGWMVGPYLTARLTPNLYFDARVAAGKSTNDISPFGTALYTDEFETDRWLAEVSLTGEFARGPWKIRPNASLAYFAEKQHAYTDSLGVAIPSQTVELGQMKLGPTFAGQFEGQNGLLFEPTFTIEAIYNMGHTLGVTPTNSSPISEGWRGRAQAGVAFLTAGGTRFKLGASYDGLFRSDLETIGLTFDLSIPLAIPSAK